MDIIHNSKEEFKMDFGEKAFIKNEDALIVRIIKMQKKNL